MAKSTQSFNAEIQQLLNLVIHSLYSKKEIFLRELISNASDAIDKRKFLALTQPNLASAHGYKITLEPDPKTKTLKIKDEGIGMSFAEVGEFIGTIAKSGSKKFAEINREVQNNPDLIGQFGVGFYSAFMVASKVTLHTQKAGTSEGTLWESEGAGEYSVTPVPRPEGAGTTITLTLKEFPEEDKVPNFTDEWVLKNLVKTYSDFVAYPIELHSQEEGKAPEVINSQKALWLRPPAEITEEEHQEFYKHLSHDWANPSKWWHWKAEGSLEFTSLVYLPSKKPWNFNMKDYEFGLSLYIKKVFIMDNNKDLLPPYLRFVKGLVDCNDLPLNVSREMLQHDRQIQIIKKNVISKIFSGLKEMLEKDRPGFESFYNEFGPTLKEGIPFDPTQKDKLADLLLFKSTHSNQWTTLTEYLSRKPEGQKAIYYITGDSLERVQNSPYLEKLKEKGFEVLLLTDAVDEWVTKELSKYKDTPLQSITDDNLDLETDEEKTAKEQEWKAELERFAPSLEKLKPLLANEVKDIKLSKRLTKTPSCLVTPEGEMSSQMQKILKQMGESTFPGGNKRVLELNPKHPLVEHLLTLSEDKIASWGEVLYYQALISEGTPLQDPARYTELMTQNLVAKAPAL